MGRKVFIITKIKGSGDMHEWLVSNNFEWFWVIYLSVVIGMYYLLMKVVHVVCSKCGKEKCECEKPF